MRLYLGIDPGRHGALALVDSEAKIVEMRIMPVFADRVDPKGLFNLIQSLTKDKDVLVTLEKPIAMPRQSSVSTLSTGINFAYCEMALASLGLAYELVPPKKWQTEMHSGIDGRIDPKVRSALKCQRLFGLDQFMRTERSKKPHDGLVDAVLIAIFGQRQSGKKEPKKKKMKRMYRTNHSIRPKNANKKVD
jgi:hypothetical protein